MPYQGKYTPKNPHKYKGDPTNIIYRSGWERQYMVWCDNSPSVLEWQSEEFFIPYKNPIDGRVRRYFPDFKLRVKKKDGSVETWVVEIKPLKQSVAPKKQDKMTKKYINEVKTYAVNHYKWKYAEQWCKDRGYKFRVMTERELGIG